MNGEVVGDVKIERQKSVYMWGYLPGASPGRTPLQSPTPVILPSMFGSWMDIAGGGCGFAMAISDTGKLITWGSTDDLGQSYVTSAKHGEIPEPFALPADASIVRAAASWAHCVVVTDRGEVYAWGWKECVPSGKVIEDTPTVGGLVKDPLVYVEQASSRSQGSKSTSEGSAVDSEGAGEETAKRRRVLSESSAANEETLVALPCLVTLNLGVRVSTVSAGGRHTLALSDTGQVWGWGYGGEGQLGLGSRLRVVSSPHPIPCIESYKKGDSGFPQAEGHGSKVPGTHIMAIACGGRHSAVITDAGALLAFGWGLYGQCGQGSTDDVLSPTCVSSLLGIRIEAVATGLWHTVCVSSDGDVYAFGGNQFGQLGTGSDQAETLPRLLEAQSIENVNAKIVSCGARHSALVTEDGKIFCWGWNKYGQLGLGDVIDRNTPCQVKIKDRAARNMVCGWWHTLLLAESPS